METASRAYLHVEVGKHTASILSAEKTALTDLNLVQRTWQFPYRPQYTMLLTPS
jgi:hypothetical protein